MSLRMITGCQEAPRLARVGIFAPCKKHCRFFVDKDNGNGSGETIARHGCCVFFGKRRCVFFAKPNFPWLALRVRGRASGAIQALEVVFVRAETTSAIFLAWRIKKPSQIWRSLR